MTIRCTFSPVSSYGDVHDHKGRWADDKNFFVVYNRILEGKPMEEQLSVQFISADDWEVEEKGYWAIGIFGNWDIGRWQFSNHNLPHVLRRSK